MINYISIFNLGKMSTKSLLPFLHVVLLSELSTRTFAMEIYTSVLGGEILATDKYPMTERAGLFYEFVSPNREIETPSSRELKFDLVEDFGLKPMKCYTGEELKKQFSDYIDRVMKTREELDMISDLDVGFQDASDIKKRLNTFFDENEKIANNMNGLWTGTSSSGDEINDLIIDIFVDSEDRAESMKRHFLILKIAVQVEEI